MKTIIACAQIAALIASAAVSAEQVSESRVWTETYPVTTATPSLVIDNIWGNVRVRPGQVGQITVTIDESRSAPNQQQFDRSLEVLRLNINADENGVSLVVGERDSTWQYRDTCRECRVEYQFEVLVPVNTQLDVGTVTEGRIDVAGIDGRISASNVNGPITLDQILECGEIESINGEVDVTYQLGPGQNCYIETINGDITLSMPAGTGLDVALDLFNGSMYSEFDVDTIAMPARIDYSYSGGRHHYRIQQFAGLRLEEGGPMYSISSLNGDIRIQQVQ